MNGAPVRGDQSRCARISLRVVGGKLRSNLTVALAARRYPFEQPWRRPQLPTDFPPAAAPPNLAASLLGKSDVSGNARGNGRRFPFSAGLARTG